MDYSAGICTFCGTGCGHFLKLEEGKAVGVFPARNHPVSRGRLCVRGWNIHELLETRDRIVEPALRREGELKAVGYEAALDHVARKLASADPDRIAVLGSPRASNEESYLLMRLARGVLGTGNLSVDAEGGHYASLAVLDRCAGLPGATGSLERIRETELLLVIDFDVTRQNPIIGSDLHFAAGAGAQLVTIDSRRTQIARLSHRFLQVHPGATGLVLAATMKSMLDQGLLEDSSRSHLQGWEELEQSLAGFETDALESRMGIPRSVVDQLARKLVSARSAQIFYPSGISGLTPDTVRAIWNLFLLSGQAENSGSGVNPVAGLNNLQGACDAGLAPDRLPGFRQLSDPAAIAALEKAWDRPVEVKRGRTAGEMLASGTPPQLMIVVDHDEGIVRYPEALAEVETLVYIGSYHNPFERFAEVVLPAASYIECDGTFTNADRRVQLSRRKRLPAEGIWPGWQLLCRLAARLGQDWTYGSPAEVMEELARVNPFYSGISHATLDSQGGLRWPLGRSGESSPALTGLEFAPAAGDLEVPQPETEYPFLLMIGKAQHFWHQNNLMKKTRIPNREYNATLLLYPEGFVEICRQDAEKVGVRDGRKVQVTSPGGSMSIKVKVSEDVRSQTAYVPYFVKGMIRRFLLAHRSDIELGENASIPVRIERIS